MQVDDTMTSPVVTVGPEETLQAAVGTMLENRVGSVVVVDPAIAGIATRSDVLRRVYHSQQPLGSLSVRDAMTEEVITTNGTASIEAVIRTMPTHKVKKLPVLEDFELEGIITTTDIARHLPDHNRELRETLERRDDWTS